jgi:archaemetzincin
MRLALKPFGSVDPRVLEYLQREVPLFESIQIASQGQVPKDAVDKHRAQFRASGFFGACAGVDSDWVLAVTDVDLFEDGLSFVFGFAEKPGRVAVISTARLGSGDGDRFLERALKEAVHELGHTFGLDHDEGRPGCVMKFSRTLADTDRKSREFCPACQREIKARGTPRRR